MRSTELVLKKEQEDFKCNRCGACCKDRDVPLTLDDIFRLSEFMGMGPDEFFAEYCDERPKHENVIALPTLRKNGECCCFLEENICRVHFVKPAACEHMPSTLFGSLEHVRSRMPPGCSIQYTRNEGAGDRERMRRNYITATMLTTIYYSKFGAFKFEYAKPFIYRILLFKKNREQIHRLMDDQIQGN